MRSLVALWFATCFAFGSAWAADLEPVKIGFAEAQTGSLAAIGKSGIVAMQIWAEQVNARGGLLGRPVKLVYYDNQSNPANVPALYVKLLDVDRVDLILSGYGTNMAVPGMPVAINHKKLYFSVRATAINAQFHYPRSFSMISTGPDTKRALSKGYFDLAVQMTPKPLAVALVGADSEFSHTALDGARLNAAAAGLRVVYDSTYPPSTADFTPVVRALKASKPDLVYVASYPADTAGILRAAAEVGLATRLMGGNMIGLGTTTMKVQLGPLLNGIVLGEEWVPAPKLLFPGVTEFLKIYQARAAAEGVDPLGVFLPPLAYARMQVLQQAVEGTQSLDQEKMANYLHTHTVKTVVGDIVYDNEGEWSENRMVWTQFQGIDGHDLEQFRRPETEVVLGPA